MSPGPVRPALAGVTETTSASRAASSSNRFPPPPSTSGMPSGRTGRGKSSRPSTRKWAPWCTTGPPRNSAFRIVTVSARRSTRVGPSAKSIPACTYSDSSQPAPSPSSSRPPDSTSSVVASFASIAGDRKSLASTNVPSVIDVVAVAAAASAGIGANCSPKWSGIDTVAKPRSSARRQAADQSGPDGALVNWRAKRIRRSCTMPSSCRIAGLFGCSVRRIHFVRSSRS